MSTELTLMRHVSRLEIRSKRGNMDSENTYISERLTMACTTRRIWAYHDIYNKISESVLSFGQVVVPLCMIRLYQKDLLQAQFKK